MRTVFSKLIPVPIIVCCVIAIILYNCNEVLGIGFTLIVFLFSSRVHYSNYWDRRIRLSHLLYGMTLVTTLSVGREYYPDSKMFAFIGLIVFQPLGPLLMWKQTKDRKRHQYAMEEDGVKSWWTISPEPISSGNIFVIFHGFQKK